MSILFNQSQMYVLFNTLRQFVGSAWAYCQYIHIQMEGVLTDFINES